MGIVTWENGIIRADNTNSFLHPDCPRSAFHWGQSPREKNPAKGSLKLETQNVSLGSEWVLGPQVWVQVPLVSSSLESQSPQVF